MHPRTHNQKPITLERIDKTLDHLATVLAVVKDATPYIPIFERLERERETYAAQRDTLARIRRRAETTQQVSR